MGRSRRAARANASRPHGCQLTGWRAARARYGVVDCAIRFVSGPCSETQPASASSGNVRRKNAENLMGAVEDTLSVAPPFPPEPRLGGGRSRRYGPVPRLSRAVCAVSRWTSRSRPGYRSTMDATRITPKPNGPLIVEGPVRIVTPDGRELAVPPRKDGRPAEVVVLCRCGGSATKPFCDGSHKRNGFSDAPPAGLAPTI